MQSIFLSAEDVGVTEVWLRIRFSDSALSRSFILQRDSSTLQIVSNAPVDTVVLSDSLLPKHTYTYKAYRLVNDKLTDSSAALQVITTDTTTHSFSFAIDTLGDGNSSVLNDVVIIDDTLAYAVGAIYIKDSLGNFDPHAYNMARWNGRRWELMRIQFNTICGQASTTPYPAKAIFAFNATDIWVAMDGDQVARWNGTSQTATMCLPVSFSINRLWGNSPSSIYAVGYGGNVAHYSMNSWHRVESGTTLPIQDIWGGTDQATGEEQILCIASNTGQNQGKKLLQIQGTNVTALPDSGLNWSLGGAWFVPNRKYYIVGDGMFASSTITSPDIRWKNFQPGLTDYYTTAIRGTGLNNIFVVGAFGNTLHFNGVTWSNTHGETFLTSGGFVNVDVKGKLVVAAGFTGNRAIALRGYQH